MPNTVPNFDAMTPQDLLTFYEKYKSRNRALAELLVGDTRAGYLALCQGLANYASNKAAAMGCRKRGDIIGARIYEKVCDDIYDRLPEDLRW